jgi:UDP-N-acetylmuramate dehydrogenase
MSNRPLLSSDDLSALQGMTLTRFNTLGLTCEAKQVLTLASQAQLPEVTARASKAGGVVVLGGGSNVVLPAELDRFVVRVELKGITPVESSDQTAWRIDVAAGEDWHDWVEIATKNGWFGLENLALIPGTVGAAPVQNIGAYGVELQDRIESVTAWHIPEGRLVTLSKDSCGFAYRDSIFKRDALGTWLIVSVRFLLPKKWMPVLSYPDLKNHVVLSRLEPAHVKAEQILQAVCEVRRAKLPDPAVLGNAGSFFKNPVVSETQYLLLKAQFPALIAYPQTDQTFKLAAGWLIERCGWKGKRLGAVGVHDRQALVLVNYGGAQASELMALAHEVRASVKAQFGVDLEIEPVVVPGS